MGVIADLMVHVGTDLKEFKTGMGEVNSKVEEAGGGFSRLGAFALGAGAAAAVAVTGVVAFGMHAVESATEAGQAAFELSERYGIARDAASQWIVVAGQVGVSQEALGLGFRNLSKNVEAIQFTLDRHGKITAQQAQPYKELGISIFDASGHMKNANELMLEAADRFKGMEDGPMKSALAMKLFGRSGADLLPMLNEGSAALREQMKAAQDNGRAMSGDAVEGAHKYFMEQKQLEAAMQGITVQIGTFLMPIMVNITNYMMSSVVPALREMWTWFKEHLFPALVQVYAGFMQLIGPALEYIKTHFDDLKPVLIAVGVVFLVVVGIIVVAIGVVVAVIVGLVFAITWLTGQIRAHADQWAANVQNFVISALLWFKNLVEFIRELPGKVAQAAVGMWDGLWDSFRGILNKIIGAWNHLSFTVGGGTFAGVSIPSMTLSVPQIPTFHNGGMVPGSGETLAILLGGERVLNRKDAASYGSKPMELHIHIDQGAYIDPVSVDRLGNYLAQRFSYVTGR